MRYTESIPDFRFLEESIQWVGQKLVSPEFMVVLPLTSEIRSTFIGHLDSHFRTFFDLEHISFVCLFVCFALSGFLSYFEGSSINDITNTLINTWTHYLFTLLPFKRWRHIWMTLKFINIKFFSFFFGGGFVIIVSSFVPERQWLCKIILLLKLWWFIFEKYFRCKHLFSTSIRMLLHFPSYFLLQTDISLIYGKRSSKFWFFSYYNGERHFRRLKKGFFCMLNMFFALNGFCLLWKSKFYHFAEFLYDYNR